jgi:hypothetical protein
VKYCFDVIDAPEGNDPSPRPNQILAVSLPEGPLTHVQQGAVVDACGRELLTSFAVAEPSFGTSGVSGNPWHWASRTGWHISSGTVRGWLLGPFAQVHLRVFGDPAKGGFLLGADRKIISGLMAWAQPVKFSMEIRSVSRAAAWPGLGRLASCFVAGLSSQPVWFPRTPMLRRRCEQRTRIVEGRKCLKRQEDSNSKSPRCFGLKQDRERWGEVST